MRLKICESKQDWQAQLKEFSHDFYHTWDYYQTVTGHGHTAKLFIVMDGNFRKMAFPLIERPTELEGKRDLIGAYGYSGPLFNFSEKERQNEVMAFFFSELQSLNYVSLFSRTHPTLNSVQLNCMDDSGEVVLADLSCGIDELYRNMRKVHRRDIKKLKNSDFRLKISATPSEQDLSDFIHVYETTMHHLAADDNYYFTRAYYEVFFNSSEFVSYLISVEDPETNTVIASAVMVNCCSHFQYHLSGTLPDYYSKYPMKLILGATLELAVEKDASVFILGGGVGGNRDSLFDFKYGFTKKVAPFRTISRVLDQNSYEKLVDMKSEEFGIPADKFYDSGYFPAYRNSSLC